MADIETYVDDATGDDDRLQGVAINPATPWKTVKGALAKIDASASAVNVNITNGHAENVGDYLNINYNFANQVTFRPVTDVADGATAWTMVGTGGGSAVIRPHHADTITLANIRFEHCAISATGDWTIWYCVVAGTISNLEFRDCTFTTSSATKHIFTHKSTAVDGLYFTRCTFTAPATTTVDWAKIQLGDSATTDVNIDDVVFDGCTFAATCRGLWCQYPGTGLRISDCTINAKQIAIHLGTAAALGNRIKHVVVENTTVTTTGDSHVAYFNADNVVVQNCTFDTGTTGDYALVTKYGTGYAVCGNDIHSRVSPGAALVAKGVTDACYCGNRIYAHGSQYAVQIYTNTDADGVAAKNVSVVYNVIATSGAAAAFYIPAIDTDGYVHVNGNKLGIGGTGDSNILGTTATGSTQTAMAAAWVTEGYPYNETLGYRSGRVARDRIRLLA